MVDVVDVVLVIVTCVAASVSVGAAHAAILAARDHLGIRKQFGKPLKDFQVTNNNSTRPDLYLTQLLDVPVHIH